MIDYWDTKQLRNEKTISIINNKIELNNVVISAITKLELLAGIGNKKELEVSNKKLNRFNIALISNESTFKAFELMLKYRPEPWYSITRLYNCRYCNYIKSRIIYIQSKGL